MMAADLERSAAAAAAVAAAAEATPNFRANVEVTPIEGRCQGNDANAAGWARTQGQADWARKCSVQPPHLGGH